MHELTSTTIMIIRTLYLTIPIIVQKLQGNARGCTQGHGPLRDAAFYSLDGQRAFLQVYQE